MSGIQPFVDGGRYNVTPAGGPPVTPAASVTPTQLITTPTPTPSPGGFVQISDASGVGATELGTGQPATKIGFNPSGGRFKASVNSGPLPFVPDEPTEWFNGSRTASTGNSYEIRADYISGSSGTEQIQGTQGVWQDMASSRGWEWRRTTLGIYSATIRFQIRDKATQTVQDTMDYSIFLNIFV